ncbi:hypothetical protein [Empedobacter brevis]|uniref:hypothetical protein n=1 Tax=Empedobacter brevis TaxID=247 RepID=UPI0039AF4237
MKKIFLALCLCLSVNLLAQEKNFPSITSGEMILKNNQKIKFSSLEEEGDKIYFFNLNSQQREHVYKSSILSIEGIQLIEPDLQTKQNVEKQSVVALEYINSRNILQHNKKLSKGDLINILSPNNSALNQYKSGVSQKNIGTVLIIAGAGLFVGNGIANISTSNSGNERKSPTFLFIIGGGLAASGIVLKITGANSIKKSVETYNKQSLAYNDKSNLDFKFLVSNNGAGLRLNF